MSFKGLLLKNLDDYGIRRPDEVTQINENDKNNNRFIWYIKGGQLVFDVYNNMLNYLYQVENQNMEIHSLYTIDEAIIIALKYLM